MEYTNIIKGKYNECKIFTPDFDAATFDQLCDLMNQPCVAGSKIRIMVDCHAGKGCVIGTTMTLIDKVIPNLVGVDIGCGVSVYKLDRKEIDLEKLDKIINKKIPNGFNVHGTSDLYLDKSFNEYNFHAPVDLKKAKLSLGTLGGGE